MDIRKIRKIIELINETGVGEIELKSGEESVRISRNVTSTQPILTQAPVQTAAIPTEATQSHTSQHASGKRESSHKHAISEDEGYVLKSPMVGTVYLSSTPGAKPFVEVGRRVEVGDTLCLIEAMKMFNQIEADRAGVISARLIENEQPVEYDQPLFIIETDE